jgi:hypothetical protein
VSAASEREQWVAVVRAVAADRDLRYEPVGGLNPRDAPPALCPGGANRLTGELTDGFWGASCDGLEHEEGGMFSKAILPGGVLVKAHMPDLTRVVPAFDVESIEARPDEQLRKHTARRVEFESIEFNRRSLTTVPSDHDPIALRELFSPGFLSWATTIDREVDFGASERQLWFMWRLRERSRDELELALEHAGNLFARLRRELEEANVAPYPAGPWNAGLAPFPGAGRDGTDQPAGGSAASS